ncbi:MAG: lysylphosphatidylglycerol synthase transmembrane domain-containing protein [Paludibacteraceae bacterium]
MKDKQQYIKILNWMLVIAAYAYLIYKLVTFEDYATMATAFRNAHFMQYIFFGISIILFPLNIWLESWKWQYMLRGIEPMSMREAQEQVYYGMIAGFLTPYRVGDFPSRALLMRNRSNWLAAVGMGLVGSFALTMVIIILGLPTLFVFFSDSSLASFSTIFAAAILCTLLCIFAPIILRKLAKHPWKKEKVRTLIRQLSEMRYMEFAMVMLQSLLRYLCFAVQIWLTMLFCGIELSPTDWLISIPLYYLLITITPNIPVAEIGVRGSLAMLVFGHYSPEYVVPSAIAAMLVWVVNTIFPLLVGMVVSKEVGKRRKDPSSPQKNEEVLQEPI